jgi:hypothetical protein
LYRYISCESFSQFDSLPLTSFLLAKWLLLWLSSRHTLGVADGVALDFLINGASAAAQTRAALKRNVGDVCMQMLNLSHEWLRVLFFHSASKIDRVSFGLLSTEDLAVAKERDPFMPKSRKLLAVPFLGKDVPSRSSEFSHPDVVIGLTTLAYRYEGLRMKDFKDVIIQLYVQLGEETGPFRKRGAYKQWVRWVELAGGSVRGSSKKGAAEQAKAQAARKRRSSLKVSLLLYTVTFYANLAHSLTRSP